MAQVSKKYTWKEFEEHCKTIEQATTVPIAEPAKDKHARIAKLKKDYNGFCQYYFPHYCADEITGQAIDCADFHIDLAEEALTSETLFAIAEWAREHAKSVHCCIMIQTFLWVWGELKGLILIGKDEDAAKRLLADLQAEFASNDRLKADFGDQKTIGSWAEGDFELKDGTFFIALGRGQSPRGLRKRQHRPNCCVIDDIDDDELVLNQKRVRKVVKWILGAVYPALSTKRKRLFVAGNRIHQQSVLAHLVGDITPDTPKRRNIYHSKITALDKDGNPNWPQKFTRAHFEQQRSVMGEILFQREYMHNPVIEGTIFKHEWVQWGKVPPLNTMDALAMYCDPSYSDSATSDTKAIALWGIKGRTYYKIKVFCRRCSITTMVKWWYEYHKRRPQNCNVGYYMEATFFQKQLLGDFETEGESQGFQLPVSPDFRPKPDKFMRIVTNLQPLYERGLVIHNEDERGSPDMQESINQTLAIEPGTNTADDGPDADEGAVWMLNQVSRLRKVAPIIGARTSNSLF